MITPRPSRRTYIASLLLFYLLLRLRCYWTGEVPWQPKSWRTYPVSRRISQASDVWYAEQTNSTRFTPFSPSLQGDPPLLCIGIDAILRPGTDYLPGVIGSALMPLSESERRQIHLIVQFRDGLSHPHYSAAQLLADQVTSRPGVPPNTHPLGDIDWVQRYTVAGGLPAGITRGDAEGTLDYEYLLRSCLDTGAPYLLMLENDVVSRSDWFDHVSERLIPAMERVGLGGIYYVMMFWDNTLLGWETEDTPYLILTIVTLYILLLALRTVFLRYTSTPPDSPIPKPITSPHSHRSHPILTTLLFPLFLSPHLILILSQGRHTLSPPPLHLSRLPPSSHLDSVALLFPRASATSLVEHYLHDGYTDGRNPVSRDTAIRDIERRGETRGGGKWVYKPSLWQHVGTVSSKGYVNEHRVRNWAFEGWSWV